MQVTFSDGKVYNTETLTVLELELAASDLRVQVEALECEIERREADFLSMKSRYLKDIFAIKKRMAMKKQQMGDILKYTVSRRIKEKQKTKETNISKANGSDRILLQVIQDMIDPDDFRRFVFIAQQRQTEEESLE